MIALPATTLPLQHAATLAEYQKYVNHSKTYHARVERAKAEFQKRNKKTNACFVAVRATLDAMCSGARRCCYCEDSMADEVEHFRPKDIFPELVFVWENYLYACGPCNGPKGNKFAVIVAGERIHVVERKPGVAPRPPPAGDPVLIDPRSEDPLDFMMLDLVDTFYFVPSGATGSVRFRRGEYTIGVLHLNDRDMLPKARHEAYEDYCAHLVRYTAAKRAGAPPATLSTYRRTVQGKQHPTVWAEMKRQYDKLPTLRALFEPAPEALTW